MRKSDAPLDECDFGWRRFNCLAFVRMPDRSLVPCVIRNLSDGDALLEFRTEMPIENSFTLLTGSSLGDKQCEVVHRHLNTVGVGFDLFGGAKPAKEQIK